MQELSMVLLETVIPRSFYKGFYLESLNVPAERWAEGSLKILLKNIFLRACYFIHYDQ